MGEYSHALSDALFALGFARSLSVRSLTPTMVHQRFRKLALKTHPDRAREEDRASAHTEFVRLQAARDEVLSALRTMASTQWGSAEVHFCRELGSAAGLWAASVVCSQGTAWCTPWVCQSAPQVVEHAYVKVCEFVGDTPPDWVHTLRLHLQTQKHWSFPVVVCVRPDVRTMLDHNPLEVRVADDLVLLVDKKARRCERIEPRHVLVRIEPTLPTNMLWDETTGELYVFDVRVRLADLHARGAWKTALVFPLADNVSVTLPIERLACKPRQMVPAAFVAGAHTFVNAVLFDVSLDP